jgi:hypothetical protein
LVQSKVLAQVFTKGISSPVFVPSHGPDASTRRLVLRALLGNNGTREVRFERVTGKALVSRLREEIGMAVKEGWRGRFFEDFEVGDVYEHPLGRTVTTTDNLWFTLLTQNTAPIHVDHAYAEQTEFGRPLVDSTFTVALVTGQSVTDVSQNVFANLG